MIIDYLVCVFIAGWSWYVRRLEVHSPHFGDARRWRGHIDLADWFMELCHGPSSYENFTLTDDEPTQDERNAGPMVWNPTPTKEITSEETRRAYRDWNIRACAPRRAPDLVAAGWVAAR